MSLRLQRGNLVDGALAWKEIAASSPMGRRRGCYPVCAAASAGENVVLAFDLPARAEKVLKHLQFDAAKALADHCGGADRAVIFDQQKARARKRFDPRHVAFGRPD